MAKNTNKVFSKEQIKKIDSIYPEFHSLIQQLDGVVHPNIIKTLENMKESLTEVMKPIWDEDEEAFEENAKQLDKVRDENNFQTIWSVSEVLAKDLNQKMPFKIGTIYYESWGKEVKREINKKITWLEAWKVAEELILSSGDNHHIFIEDFHFDKDKGIVRLSTGS